MPSKNNPFDKEYVAKAMKVGRAEKGWSQEELAEASKVSSNAIARYETAENCMGLDMAVKICDAFNWPLDRLVGREQLAERKQ